MDGKETKTRLLAWLALLLLISLFFSDTPNRYWALYKLFFPGQDGPEPYFPAVCAAWAASSALYLLGVAGGLKLFGLALSEAGWKLPDRPLNAVVAGVLAGAAGLLFNFTVLNTVLYRIQAGAWKILPFSISDPRVGGQDAYGLFMGLTAWVFAPVFEELAFRGVIYTAIERRGGKAAALALSSALFALSHFYILSGAMLQAPAGALLNQFLKYLVLGLVLGFIRMRGGSLLPSIAGHAAINIAVSAVAWYK